MSIYADHAATTAMSEAAIEAMTRCMREYYGNPSSLYRIGQQAKEVLEQAREDIASVIHAESREIYFTSGGSEADNQAIRSAALAGKKKGKNHIISTAFEHHAVLHTLEQLKTEGFEVTLLDVHENGVIRPEEVEAALRPETCLVTVMYANNEIGTIGPLSIDVQAENIDYLSASSHKFHGPKGVGFLYARKGVPLLPLINGGAQEKGKRAGTENLPGIVGMAAALKETVAERDAEAVRLTGLRDRLIAGLKEIPHSALNGDAEKRLPGNVSFCFEGIEGESLLLLLDEKGISASSGSACTSGSLDPSHVLLAIGRVHDVAHGSLRLTLGRENTPEDVEYIISAVKDVVTYLRGFSPVWRDLQSGKTPFIL